MERIRHGIRLAMARLGCDTPAIEQETILVQDGHYCGRRFRGLTIEAVWFQEAEQIKFYDAGGALLEVFSTEQIIQLNPRQVA